MQRLRTINGDMPQTDPMKYLHDQKPFVANQRVGTHKDVVPQLDFRKIIEHNRTLYIPSQRMQDNLTHSELARTYAGPTNRQFGAINTRDYHQKNHRTFIDQKDFGRSSSTAGLHITPQVSINVGAIRS
jgi:hypothetical protein